MQEQHHVTLAQLEWQPLFEEATALMMRGDFQAAVKLLQETTLRALDETLGRLLNDLFSCKAFLRALKVLGGKLGLCSRGTTPITIVLPGGTRYEVKSPFFYQDDRQGRRKRKRGPGKHRGRHLALELFGFMDRVSPSLAFRALALSALCPSFKCASTVLEAEGVGLSPDKLRKLAAHYDGISPQERAQISSGQGESLAGKRVLICSDGGRYRQRVNKQGRVPKELKRRGFTTDWREPKLLTIAVLKDDGELDRSFPLQVDASMDGLDPHLELIRGYLEHLDIDQAREVILVGDGAPWIWNHLPPLLHDCGVTPERLTEVLDHAHAKQNLLELTDHLKGGLPGQQQQRQRELKDLLWQGRIDELAERLKAEARHGRKRAVAKKAREYFLENAHRLQYANCEAKAIPRGSGIVESAIRRVINLRVKSAGSFWLQEKAQTMIFLRAKLLYGRWHHLVYSWKRDLKDEFSAISAKIYPSAKPTTLKKAAA